ncbi:MAG TPA: SURF1 family protein [Burkholderiales bacterium]|nr:SURF1 family protein [Burkholderiales bacterium]
MKPGPGNSPSRPPLRFRPPWWGVLLAALGCAAGIALGNWQTGRAADKRALAASLVPVTLRGALVPEFTVFLDNKLYLGRPGYQVVQPLRLADGRHVLVNRGWAPAGASRAQLPVVRTPAAEINLSGLRLEHFAQAYEPAAAKPEGKVWQNITVERFAAWSGLALEPWVIEQHSPLDDGLVRDWPRPDLGVEMHESYALQWYSLAALSVILLLALNIRRDGPAAG